jgi:23S rRNA (uracil1939-C5)-methyltransferase
MSIQEIISQNSKEEFCPHFGTCGGCIAQDKSPSDYRIWKEGIIYGAFHQHSLDFQLDEFISCAPHSRRRITLAFTKSKNGITLGFHAARSHDIVPIHICLVAKPELPEILPALRMLLQHVTLRKKEGTLTLLASETGLDAAIDGVKELTSEQRAALAQAARQANLARLSVNGEVLIALRTPVLKAGKALLTPPPGAFVQAVAKAEEVIGGKICEALKKYKSKRIADLFAGCGAFSLRVAEFCTVHAVENHEAALQALQKAAHSIQGLKPITIEKRDLFRRPLLPQELNTYDAVILDPPRQGASAQIVTLSKSKVKLIAYVSCNPGTFARDAKVLTQAGYKLIELTAIDQFLWSEHIELIAIFVALR